MTNQPIHELGPVILSVEVYVERRGKFLMHKRADDYPRWPGRISAPGGRIDVGEDIFTAAVRELKEETGVALTAQELQLKAVALHHHVAKKETWVIFVCRATLIGEPPELIHSPEGSSLWLSREELQASDKLFKPSAFYFDHVLPDRPGIMYTNIDWDGDKLVRVHSQTTN